VDGHAVLDAAQRLGRQRYLVRPLLAEQAPGGPGASSSDGVPRHCDQLPGVRLELDGRGGDRLVGCAGDDLAEIPVFQAKRSALGVAGCAAELAPIRPDNAADVSALRALNGRAK
jgi:hypothetical protein